MGGPVAEVSALAAANPKLAVAEAAGHVVSRKWVERTGRCVLEFLKDFHARNPELPGAPIALARMNLEPALAALAFASVPVIRISGEAAALERVEAEFRKAGLQPAAPLEI